MLGERSREVSRNWKVNKRRGQVNFVLESPLCNSKFSQEAFRS